LAGLEIFADVSCPFTHVALRRLVQRRAQRGAQGVRFLLRAWPLELVNGEPTAAAPRADEFAAQRARVAPDLLAGLDPDRPPVTSLPALALADRAYRVDAATGERVSLLLRSLLFEDGGDISDPRVLDDIANRCGLPPDSRDLAAVIADLDEGRARGVVGSPHFFAPGLDEFCPTLAVGRVDGRLYVTAQDDAIDRIIDRCLHG
jgi:predicted DsbA family dithiol-disulfide isomerase